MKQKTIVVFDFDKTISCKDTYLPFLWLAIKQAPRRILPAIKLPFAVFLYYAGVIDNSKLKCIFLQTILGKASKEHVHTITKQFIKQLFNGGLFEEAIKTIEHHKSLRHRLVLASASFDFYIRPIAEQLGFDDCVCTHAAWSESGVLLGTIDGENCYGKAKLQSLTELIDTRNEFYIVCYSDHYSDFPILQWADKAYIVNPSNSLLKKIKNTKIEKLKW